METQNNTQVEAKFKNLSTQKKILHYIGWPLLVLGCVGTIVFGSLWCKNRGNSEPDNIIQHTFTEEEVTKNTEMGYYSIFAKCTIEDSIQKNQIYEFTIPNSYFNGQKFTLIDFSIGEETSGIDGSNTPTNTSDSQLFKGEEKIIFTDPEDYVTINSITWGEGGGNISVVHGGINPISLEMGTKDLSARCSCSIDINTPRVIYFTLYTID